MPKKQTTRQRAELLAKGIDPDTGQALDAEPQSASGSPAPAASAERRRPAGYGSELLWEMATEFERLAYKHRVSLGGRGVPYIYKALAQSVDRSGIQKLECRDGNSEVVKGAELGIRLVRFFWARAPWDRDGDVVSQFADPIMFEDCLKALQETWKSRRSMKVIRSRMKNEPVTTDYRPRPRRPETKEDN